MNADVVVNRVRPGFYLDSVALMRISSRIAAAPGVVDASLMIGSPANKTLLREAGLLCPPGDGAGPDDLILAVRARAREAAEHALDAARVALEELADTAGASAGWRPRTLRGALEILPQANLVLVSVPGDYAATEARRALEQGLNVLLYSDNVSLEQEVALKRLALERELLMMGPDCGTAYVGGVPLGFANRVARGPVGVVAASGTGLQELAVQLTRAGSGISHGLGVGGRDLSAAVGAMGTYAALALLEADPATEAIALVSKPPDAATAQRVLERLAASAKPSTACFIGHAGDTSGSPVPVVRTMREATEALVGGAVDGSDFDPLLAAGRRGQLRSEEKVRGLFCGGSLCAEAQAVLVRAGLQVASNVPVPGASLLTDPSAPPRTLIDLGADEYTVGRPHPMIDPSLRNEMLREALAEPGVAVVLVDVVLGYGAHPDPAGEVARVVNAFTDERPLVVASVCGVEGDPQGYASQCRALERAGVVVAPSNAQAAEVVSCAMVPDR